MDSYRASGIPNQVIRKLKIEDHIVSASIVASYFRQASMDTVPHVMMDGNVVQGVLLRIVAQ
ncbi:MAG: hypothetical protein BWY82_02644 [Verrucomicrobia bacterium ADurb.Bin474]|nr:MAG: hypothetical protein BWY82_02644 [Verrucomicrobia bacterium ADurb.Bin474]